MHDYLIGALNGIVTVNSRENGIDTLINVSTTIKSEVLLNALNEKGIMVSSKSTCGSRENEANRTLNALGIDEDYAIRISFDYTNTKDELQYFVDNLKEILDKYG